MENPSCTPLSLIYSSCRTMKDLGKEEEENIKHMDLNLKALGNLDLTNHSITQNIRNI